MKKKTLVNTTINLGVIRFRSSLPNKFTRKSHGEGGGGVGKPNEIYENSIKLYLEKDREETVKEDGEASARFVFDILCNSEE